jgi:rhamnulokinase
MPVIAPATHDTGSAIAAVPASGTSWAYISSGTWSLMGAELTAPLINDKAEADNFTNEGGVGGTIRFLKNIMGLWLVQECRRTWERAGKAHSYDELGKMAQAAPAFAAIVNPDYGSFILPSNMPAALAEFCSRTGQPTPVEPGAVVRCALESLALRYRWTLEKLEELTGRRLEVIHIVGGGCQNELLCQFTADACNRTVLAGPVEATAIGNVLVQAIGLGILGSLGEAREVVRKSFEVRMYSPGRPQAWDEPYQRFLTYLSSTV